MDMGWVDMGVERRLGVLMFAVTSKSISQTGPLGVASRDTTISTIEGFKPSYLLMFADLLFLTLGILSLPTSFMSAFLLFYYLIPIIIIISPSLSKPTHPKPKPNSTANLTLLQTSLDIGEGFRGF